ncbi:hypothetical protein M569_01792 [Genlisea aurea]|uniref:Pentacotripeptide-repeat region of PRORP domain-containing protein n=1 Tax=Genlisea aurea TaxID=192259 RepID=S8EK51_9LAMI|nr:hypothetical protein M569_01792 [Genlisea aurea]
MSMRIARYWFRSLLFLKTLESSSLNAHRSIYSGRVLNELITSGQRQVHSLCSLSSDEQGLDTRKKRVQCKFVCEIVSILRNDGKDLESRLIKLAPRLSLYTITEIFEALNTQRVSGLKLFIWIRNNSPKLHKSARVCSLLIDNLGRLGAYDTMLLMLKEFSSHNICLTYEAFGFLPVSASTESSSLAESTKRVVDFLNQAGGSCRNSGLYALVEMFSALDMFHMARYVMKITEIRRVYFTVMIREMCKRDLFEDAIRLIKEMEESTRFFPDANIYNHILGSLLRTSRIDEASKIFSRMRELDVKPDGITYEILINSHCSLGRLEDAKRLLDEMGSIGIEPRIETHALIIKAMFATGEEYEGLRKHVVEYSGVYRTSANTMHTLMADLHCKRGDVLRAAEVLSEMMKCRNLKPDFNVYMDVVMKLKRARRVDLAWDLQSMYSRFLTVG